jgi:hypothetical protein
MVQSSGFTTGSPSFSSYLHEAMVISGGKKKRKKKKRKRRKRTYE